MTSKCRPNGVFHEHAVPGSPEVLAFIQVMQGRFPTLEVDRFLAQED